MDEFGQFDKSFDKSFNRMQTFVTVFIAIVFVMVFGGIAFEIIAYGYMFTHPEVIGHFFGSIVKGFYQ